jgi:hypothetical protein
VLRLEIGRSFVFCKLRRFLIPEPLRLEMCGKRINSEENESDLKFEAAGSEVMSFGGRE